MDAAESSTGLFKKYNHKNTSVFNKLNFHTVQAILGSSAPLSIEKKKVLYRTVILINITTLHNIFC